MITYPTARFYVGPNKLDHIYNLAVENLISAAEKTIPKIKPTFFKHWWTPESSKLKQESIKTHQEWINYQKSTGG